jgi:hypothetical protein
VFRRLLLALLFPLYGVLLSCWVLVATRFALPLLRRAPLLPRAAVSLVLILKWQLLVL